MLKKYIFMNFLIKKITLMEKPFLVSYKFNLI